MGTYAAGIPTSLVPTTDILNQGNRPGDGPLRPGGQPPPYGTGTLERDPNLPSTPSAATLRQLPALVMCRDLAAGPERIRERNTAYLPQAPGEDPANYRVRLFRSVFFNVFGHTVKALVGQVFRRDPVLGDDVPQIILDACENIDLAGTHFDVFAREILQDDLTAGHAGILVEFPQTNGAQNPRQEAMGEIRPYWVPIKKDDIVSWRSASENGHQVLTQLVLREVQTVPNGAFGDKLQTRYRVLYKDALVVGWRLLEVTPQRTIETVDEGLYPTQDEIPFAEIISSGRRGLLDSEPPLIDLAYMNIGHYQQWSDYAHSIHKTCVPLLVRIGVDNDGQPVIVGPNTVMDAPQGSDVKYVSHSGAALNECKQALDDLKSDMGTLGLSMLSPSRRTAETAQAKRLDKSSEDSALAVTARGLQDGLERALDFHAKYLNLDDGGSVTINREFDEQSMQADMLTAWTAATAAGLPERFQLEAMQAGGLIDPDENVDDVVDEMTGNKQAIADQKALDASSNLATAAAMNPPAKAPPKGAVDIQYGDNGRPVKLVPAA